MIVKLHGRSQLRVSDQIEKRILTSNFRCQSIIRRRAEHACREIKRKTGQDNDGQEADP